MNWWNPIKLVAGAFSGFFDKRLWPATIGGRSTTSRENVSEDNALNYSAVWCATRLLCGTGAGLPLGLFRGLDAENRTADRKHQVFRALNRRPNPEMTAFNFRSVMWQWQVNWGNAYAEIEREGNDPDGGLVNLWPLHPYRVHPKRDESERLYYHVDDDRPGEPGVDLEPWQMLHVPSIITYDGIFGHGVIAHARESIGAGIAAEKYGAHWFGGAAVPRTVIEHPGRTWDEEARNEFRKEWDDIYSGSDGHRVALLMGGATIKPLSMSAEDSQFLQTRQFGVEEIARWYGIPPHLLQHLLRATFNNIEHLGISFVQYSLIEWLNVWEQCIAQKLFTEKEREDLFVEHNVSALMRGDAASRSSYYQTLINSGVMTRNQAMKLENLPTVEGGDTYLVQGAMVPLDEDGKPESKFAESGSASEPPMNNGDMEEDEEEMDDGEEIMSAVSNRVQTVLKRDLSRILTKESNRMVQNAKKPDSFLASLDKFYDEHSAFVMDAVSGTIAALNECGAALDAEAFAARWIESGKSIMLEVSGLATPAGLADLVKMATESDQWKKRPEKAVEGISSSCPEIAFSRNGDINATINV